jgi:hypothetical protein
MSCVLTVAPFVSNVLEADGFLFLRYRRRLTKFLVRGVQGTSRRFDGFLGSSITGPTGRSSARMHAAVAHPGHGHGPITDRTTPRKEIGNLEDMVLTGRILAVMAAVASPSCWD